MWIPGGALTVPALFAAGAASSVHCALMCGSLGALQSQLRGSVSAPRALAVVHLGRICSYGALGALAGSAGARLIGLLPDANAGRWPQGLAAAVLMILGIQQIVRTASRRGSRPGCCIPQVATSSERWPPSLRLFARGAAWGLMPCGLLYSMVLLAAFSRNAVGGALFLSAFAAGSAPLLALAGFTGAWRPSQRHLTRLAGAAMISLGGLTLAALADPAAARIAAWCQTGP